MFKIAVVTPTNNTKHLFSCYRSLQEQTYNNWVWCVMGNNFGEDNPSDWMRFIGMVEDDPRVKVINADSNSNIGAIKRDAFLSAIKMTNPEIVVELDHDDILLPTALSETVKVFVEDPEVGFVYSDCARFRTDGKEPVKFGEAYGWTGQKTGKIHFAGYTEEPAECPCVYTPSWEPTAHSLRYIWYAPDHLRAWRVGTYLMVGGHNKDLSVCDDHELLIRTYLSSKMVRIPKPLYLYREHHNTVVVRNKEIQETTIQLHRKYCQRLAERWADLYGLSKVDIGGGIFAKDGYTTIDLRDTADIKFDLNHGIPLPENSVGVLNASHIIEHLKDPCRIMREIHRVLAPNGFAFIEVPSTDGRGAWQDPTHVSFWNENSFWYYTRKTQSQFIDHVEGMKDVRFMEDRLDTVWWDNHIAVTHAWLIALKPNSPRVPGQIHI